MIQIFIEDELEINSQTKRLLHDRIEKLKKGKVLLMTELLQKLKAKELLEK